MAQRVREVVVVTGASGGLGRAIAREFAKDRADVAVIARGRDGLEGARREIEACGARALVVRADVSDAAAVEDAARQVENAFGPIDVWVNNAMVSVFSPVKQMASDDYRRVTEVTYLGAVHGTMAALKRMLPRDHGVIVQVGSALAYRAIPLQSAYCAAKHALKGFTQSLRTELLHDRSRVRVSMVEMPALNTPQFDWSKNRMPRRAQPVPPIFQPEVGARAVVWAARNDRRDLYVGWPTVKAIVGNKLVPGYADRYLARHGYASQLADEPEVPNRPHNLWEPVAGDHGAHGRFDAVARPASVQAWATTHRRRLAVCVLGLATAAAWWTRRVLARGPSSGASSDELEPMAT